LSDSCDYIDSLPSVPKPPDPYADFKSDNLLDVLDISKKYSDDVFALSPINFGIKQGEIIGIAGKSGSGKSTLLKIIAGFLDPTSGKVRINNKNILFPADQLVAGNKEIKLVFQDFNLHPKTTIYDNLEIEIRKYGQEFSKKRILYLLEALHISHLANSFPYQLSGGEKQRVAIAKSIADVPTLLILDEPFASLDPILRQELTALLLKLFKEEEVTAIIADHDVSALLSISDKILVLDKGNLQSFTTPENTYNHPANIEVAKLLGEINIVNGAELSKIFSLNIPAKSVVAIKPEHVYLSKTGVKANVSKVLFKSWYYLVFVQIDNIELKLYSRRRLKGDVFVKIKQYQTF